MQHWLKMLHYRPERDRAFWETLEWISDRHIHRDSRVIWRPSYKVGDLVVLYLSGTYRCPAIVRVTAPADYDPARVEREGLRGDGDRWGWLTEVEPVAYTNLEAAPTLSDIGVPNDRVMRRTRLKLRPEQFEAARRLIV
jgi:hypothetical protein